MVLPHNPSIISLPFSSCCLCFETYLLFVRLQGFVVDNCGHDLVGFVGLIWWVLVVLGDGFDGVKIGLVGFGWGWEWGGWVGGGRFEVERKVRANDRDQRSKIHVLGNWRLSPAGFHSFNQRFLSLSSLRWLLPPCWIQWCWFVLLFLLSYSVFSLILLFVWFPRKWRERKIKIGNWDINELIFGFNYNRFHSIFVLFSHSKFPWISVYLPRKWRKGKYKIGNRDFDGVFLGLNYNGACSICILFHLQSLTLMLGLVAEKMEGPKTLLFVTYLYCNVFVLSIVPFIFRIVFDTLICLMLHLIYEKMKTKKKGWNQRFWCCFCG